MPGKSQLKPIELLNWIGPLVPLENEEGTRDVVKP
jgi:hypothetical protein